MNEHNLQVTRLIHPTKNGGRERVVAGVFDGRKQGRRLQSARLPWSEDGGHASAKIAGESLTFLTRMPADKLNETLPGPAHIHLLRRIVYWMVILFALVLAVETVLRIVFPWDMYLWSESPFMTNMLKLHNHQPVYSTPADGNSFVYSPGLEYLTFALLKPFGLELDIRFCRLVSTLLGVMAAGFGALAVRRLAGSTIAAARTRIFFIATWCVIWLVLSKNFLADITHPDNIHMFHATLIFWLCLSALETKRFGLAVLTIVPFLSGSARTQAGGPPAPTVDGGILALGALLVVTLVASLYASYRVSTLLTRRAAELPQS